MEKILVWAQPIVACVNKELEKGRHRRTLPRPLDQASWSSKDAGAAHALCALHRRRRPRLAQLPERPVSPVAATTAHRRRHRVWGALSLVRFGSAVSACPPALGALSFFGPRGAPSLVACHGGHRRSPQRSLPLARQSEMSPPLKSNPGSLGVFL
jgi:hypothetical protein